MKRLSYGPVYDHSIFTNRQQIGLGTMRNENAIQICHTFSVDVNIIGTACSKGRKDDQIKKLSCVQQMNGVGENVKWTVLFNKFEGNASTAVADLLIILTTV